MLAAAVTLYYSLDRDYKTLLITGGPSQRSQHITQQQRNVEKKDDLNLILLINLNCCN